MLEALDELAAWLCEGVVETDIAIPRRHQQARRGIGRKLDGGDGVGGILDKLELALERCQRDQVKELGGSGLLDMFAHVYARLRTFVWREAPIDLFTCGAAAEVPVGPSVFPLPQATPPLP